MKLLLTEVLQKVNDAPTLNEKVSILKAYETPALRGLMKINFNREINFFVDDYGIGIAGELPFKRDNKPIGYDHSLLEVEYRKFNIWFEPNNLNKLRKEQLFIQMLESLHVNEADLLCKIKDHKLYEMYPHVTKEAVVKAFFPEEVQNLVALEQPQVVQEYTEKVSSDKVNIDIPVKRGRGRPRKQ